MSLPNMFPPNMSLPSSNSVQECVSGGGGVGVGGGCTGNQTFLQRFSAQIPCVVDDKSHDL